MPTDDVENGGNSSSKDTAKEHTRSPRACTEKEYAEPRFACKSYACAIQVGDLLGNAEGPTGCRQEHVSLHQPCTLTSTLDRRMPEAWMPITTNISMGGPIRVHVRVLNAWQLGREQAWQRKKCRPTHVLSHPALQDCLARYSYDQRMCSQEIEALVACCRSLQQPQGSLHCQGFMHLIVPKEMGKPHPQQWQ